MTVTSECFSKVVDGEKSIVKNAATNAKNLVKTDIVNLPFRVRLIMIIVYHIC